MHAIMAAGFVSNRERQRDLARISCTKRRQHPLHPSAHHSPANLELLAKLWQDNIADPEHTHHESTSHSSFLIGVIKRS